mmetsp:Transcript_11224/g.1739  ORF Transcript_11224/g.1739 Transcript_11224/m.1739 type:complete len:104 (+) Transcript_11224:125-436(+)
MGLYIHHTLAISGYVVGIFYTYGATDGIWGLFFAEISNFPMHLRAIFRQVGLKYTKMYEFTELSYIIIYSLSRGIFCPVFLVYPCVISPSPIFIKFICLGIFF